MGGILQDSVITSDVYQSDDGISFYRVNSGTSTTTQGSTNTQGSTDTTATSTGTTSQTTKTGDVSVIPVIAMMALGAVGMKKIGKR